MAHRLLVLDIDGTLLDRGRPTEGLDTLTGLLNGHRGRIKLLYATGRSVRSTLDLVASGSLPVPDGIAALVGTEVWLPPWAHADPGYPATFSRSWDREVVVDASRSFGELAPQPGFLQNPYKASFYAYGSSAIVAFAGELSRRGVDAILIQSCDKYLDVIPGGAGKRYAIEYLCQEWNIPRSSVVACGDSENDLDMLTAPRHQGVLVANSRIVPANLLEPDSVYWSENNFARGVVEGTYAFSFWDPEFRTVEWSRC